MIFFPAPGLASRWQTYFAIHFIQPCDNITILMNPPEHELVHQVLTEEYIASQFLLNIVNMDNTISTMVEFGQNTDMYIQVTGKFLLRTENCDSLGGKSGYPCVINCGRTVAQETCQCNFLLPNSNYNNNSLPVCLAHRMEACGLFAINLMYGAVKCWTVCSGQQAPCNMTFYRTTVTEQPTNQLLTRIHMGYRLTLYSYFYPVFIELPAQSIYSFIGELGGIFDFWLGASIIGLVHLAVYIIKQVVNASRKNTKTGYTVRAMFGQFQPSAVIAPASMSEKHKTEENLREQLKAVKENKDFERLCDIVEEQLILLLESK